MKLKVFYAILKIKENNLYPYDSQTKMNKNVHSIKKKKYDILINIVINIVILI